MGPKLVPAQPLIGREAVDEDVSLDHEAHGTVLVRPIRMPSDLLDQLCSSHPSPAPGHLRGHAGRGAPASRGSRGRGSGSREQEVRAVDCELLA